MDPLLLSSMGANEAVSVQGMLPLCQYPADAPLSALFELTRTRLNPQWAVTALAPAPDFVFASDGRRLLFGLHSPIAAQCDDSPAGRFVRGLWEQDVAELFILDSDGVAYQEINLGPTGAWWTMKFSAQRKQDPKGFIMPRRVETFSCCAMKAWRSAIAIDLSELSIKSELSSTRANVAAILGKNPRQYFSWCHFKSQTPDFHMTEDFERIELIADRKSLHGG